MRKILIDEARARQRVKRGSGTPALTLEQVSAGASYDHFEEAILVGLALENLAILDAQQSLIFEWRVLGGLSCAEIAQMLGLSERMVKLELRTAKAWLRHELRTNAETTAK
jgi:RNA polymerase sigma factor (sigma-70 family)